MERTVIFGVAAGTGGAAPAAGALIARYAALLAAQVRRSGAAVPTWSAWTPSLSPPARTSCSPWSRTPQLSPWLASMRSI